MVIKHTSAQAAYQTARAAFLKLDDEMKGACQFAWIEGKMVILASATRQLYTEWSEAYDRAQAAHSAMFT